MYAFETATQLIARLRSGKLKARDLLEEYLDRVDRLNPKINAIIWEDRAGARAAADRADRQGPLAGLPMTVKEAYDLTGSPNTWGIPELANNISSADAVVVERLRAAQGVIFGKTNVPLGLGDFQSYNAIYGTTNNPWDVSCGPGGSSGGSAAALAAGLCGLEMGSDIGGSIRNPAHFCGVFGHKPTFGLVPSRGHAPPGVLSGADIAVVGPMSRGAADLDLAMDLLSSPDALDAPRAALAPFGDRRLKDLKVAVWQDDAFASVSKACRAAVDRVADACRQGGARVDMAARPAFDSASSHALYSSLLQGALASSLPPHVYEEQKRLAASADTSDAAELARTQTADHRTWLMHNEGREKLRWAWHEFFKDFDVVLAPVTLTTAFAHDHSPNSERTIKVDNEIRPYWSQVFWAGLTGVAYLPSTVIPAGQSEPLPVGVQIIGPAWGDRTTIGVARLLEAEGFAFKARPDTEFDAGHRARPSQRSPGEVLG
ncbi:MAG: amidase [Gammaproteobacteria bacterium]|nr:amidase [Gammaproteobacteria bacterium]